MYLDALSASGLLGSQLLDDRLGDVLHGQATVHRRLLDPAEGLGLGQPHLLVEQALGSVDSGWVTGTCRALSLGRTLCTHEIVMTDDDGNRLSTVRMTNFLREIRV